MAESLKEQKEKALQAELDQQLPAIISMLPPYLPSDRWQKLAADLVHFLNRTKEGQEILLNCTPQSIVNCVRQAAEYGLEVAGPSKHCAIVKFKSTAVLIVQWQGRAFLWLRSGAITKLEASVVFEGDTFSIRQGTDPKIEHEPDIETAHPPSWYNDLKNIRGAYAVATLPNGSKQFSWVNRSQLDRLRQWVKSKNEGRESFMFRDWLPEWCRKTAVHRLEGFLQPPAEMSDAQHAAWEHAERTIEVDAVTLEEREDQNLPGATGQQVRQAKAEEPQDVDLTTGEVIEKELAEIKADIDNEPIGSAVADEILERTKVKATVFVRVAKDMGYEDFSQIPRSQQAEFERRLVLMRA